MNPPDTAPIAATVYVPPERFGAELTQVTGEAHRHLFRARRLAIGDRLRVVDGIGHAREGRVASVGRKSAQLELGPPLESRESPRRLTLLVALPRPERASWMVEKATELGVSRIAWIETARAGREVAASALARHQRVAVAALEQCGRETLPLISGPHSWAELPGLVATLDGWWILDPSGAARPAPALAADSMGLLIGPEGGWEEAELSRAVELGATAWGLGERILRVETAAIAGSALLLTSPARSEDLAGR